MPRGESGAAGLVFGIRVTGHKTKPDRYHQISNGCLGSSAVDPNPK
jgi:hypothetical protein